MLPDGQFVETFGSPHEFSAVQAGLAFQFFQLLKLLLRELYLRNLLCHSALLSDSVSVGWIMESTMQLDTCKCHNSLPWSVRRK